ncbi:MAG: pilin [Candidatus Falkowbacteria bacterium]
MKHIIKVLTLVSAIIILPARTVYAQSTAGICNYIASIYDFAMGAVGIVAALAVAVGGLMWVMSVGNPGSIGKAKGWITDGLIGLALVLSAFALLSMINKDLVFCSTTDIEIVGRKALTLPATYYGAAAQLTGVVAKSDGKNSNQYMCCVINGDLVANIGTTDQHFGSVKRCATLNTADKSWAQNDCNQFYDAYTEQFKFPASTVTAKMEQPKAGSSTTIYDGKCWDNPVTKDWCTGKDNPEYCKGRDNGSKCNTKSNTNGYCNNGACEPCRKSADDNTSGEKCTNGSADYECVGRNNFAGICGGPSAMVDTGDCFCGWFFGLGTCTCTYHK